MKGIALIGFMGSGKSTVGPLLAKSLGMPFVDLDDQVTRAAGVDVAEIFATRGEKGWRRLEGRALAEIVGRNPIVLACGGGIVLAAKNRDILKSNFVTIYLKTRTETLIDRLGQHTDRPLLNVPDKNSALRRLHSERLPIYEETADFTLITDGKQPEQLAVEAAALASQRLEN